MLLVYFNLIYLFLNIGFFGGGEFCLFCCCWGFFIGFFNYIYIYIYIFFFFFFFFFFFGGGSRGLFF